MGVLYKKCECVRTLGNKESEKNEGGICCKKTELVIENKKQFLEDIMKIYD